MLRRGALIALVAALVGAAMLASVPAATATTEPAVTFFVFRCPSRTRRSAISCPACPGHNRFRRGWAAHFDVVNRGTKPYTVDIGGLRTRELRPGQKQRLSAYFDHRGRFQYKVVGSAVPKHKGWLRVV